MTRVRGEYPKSTCARCGRFSSLQPCRPCREFARLAEEGAETDEDEPTDHEKALYYGEFGILEE